MQRTNLLLLIILFLFTGCTDEENPATPGNDTTTNITFTNLPEEISAPTGLVREVEIYIFVFNHDSVPAPNEDVQFSILSGSGEFAPSEAVSDDNGLVTSIYGVTIPNGVHITQIMARSGTTVEMTEIILTGTPRPALITLTYPNSNHIIERGESVEIDFTVTVADSSGVGIENIPLCVRLVSVDPNEEIFGSLTQPNATDSEGAATFKYLNHENIGIVAVECSIDDSFNGGVVDPVSTVLEIIPVDASINGIIISADPDYFDVYLDSIYHAKIHMTAVDEKNNPVPEVFLELNSEVGVIDTWIETDQFGQASSDLTVTGEELSAFESEGSFVIEARVAGNNSVSPSSMEISYNLFDTGRLLLIGDTELIYADDGYTVNPLTIVLKDDSGNSVQNAEIVLTSTHGVVNSPVYTDEFGVAQAVFKDIGFPSYNEYGEIVPSVITANYLPWDIEARSYCRIAKPSPVVSINVVTDVDDMQPGQGMTLRAGSRDSLKLQAVCLSQNGSLAPGWTILNWETENGYFTYDQLRYDQAEYKGINYFHPGQRAEDATIQVWVQNQDERVYSNEAVVTILPNDPSIVQVVAAPTELAVNDSSFSMITATVKDYYDNTIEGVIVNFSTDIGLLTSSESAAEENGMSSTQLYPGFFAGTAHVVASVNSMQEIFYDTAEVIIKSTKPAFIRATADPPVIVVPGVSEVTATVFDPFGNIFDQPWVVQFELVNEPAQPVGGNINGGSQSAHVITVDGKASVRVFPGTGISPIRLRAFTYQDYELEEETEYFVDIPVYNDLPGVINMSVDYEGESHGAGIWGLEIGAFVTDMSDNPVEDNIPVTFTVEPDMAFIEAGYTGSENRDGSSIRGMAFSELVYNSHYTFDTLTITAALQTEFNVVTAEKTVILPLQDGSLQLHVDPDEWNFTEDGDTCNFRIWTVVTDRNNIRVQGAPLDISSTNGTITWDGRTGTLRGTKGDFFLIAGHNFTYVDITARIIGYDIPPSVRRVSVRR